MKFRSLSWAGLLLLPTFLLSSCSTPLKNITYLYNLGKADSTLQTVSPDIYTIQPNDNLYISIISDNPEAASFLNLSQPDRNYTSESSLELITYIVDDNGTIVLPYLGKQQVGGKTTNQVRDDLQKQINNIMENASVFVKLVNRTITVLGEVNRPGQYRVNRNSMTIFEALGTAGDLSDFGNRKDVRIIRGEGEERKIATLNLTNSDITHSKYFYILPNDIIYVQPKNRIYGAKTLPFATLFTAISTAVLLYTSFRP
ncbi:polysaccharide biosynthesis/export family protein [Prolixibacter sp. NT017]|uniref:polysaccharide biosynthesis/export family protein n=1 Tax=Prolixibacter sp. NT017 TaxID=2652390 RepID=UPI0012717687|nr:polysaccharide biosynthesis/export family protein [Prolixibacter sp. NT017]GET24688.1 polysaccharide export outer membrane protein [Prolixibacter sp. NT017]